MALRHQAPENIVTRVALGFQAPENIVKRVTLRSQAPENIVKRVVFQTQACRRGPPESDIPVSTPCARARTQSKHRKTRGFTPTGARTHRKARGFWLPGSRKHRKTRGFSYTQACRRGPPESDIPIGTPCARARTQAKHRKTRGFTPPGARKHRQPPWRLKF